MNEYEGWADSDLVHVELTNSERRVLLQGLFQWGGPASLKDPLAIAMGFASKADFFAVAKELQARLEQEAPLRRIDWKRVLLATEIVFMSDVVGAGYEWETVTGLGDDETLRTLRSLQVRLLKAYAVPR
ncbi:hypothetical protein [Curtobacterium sp. Leaf261]|uniref:hypothetical protein n=1 Tax=Curtobacterium sp. Leaf261 TaxID=1736311 RepID=UPI0006FBB2C7|nr:hypothetical protein [Curtobacterium sp. Leaf261]KQO64285.1 hypothetical protein ASF23_17135 [Curtobacterium sp. Leaf261]